MTDYYVEPTYAAWLGKKATTLRRRTLDCGHLNVGEAYYHLWCDRISCSEACAAAEHGCGESKGNSSSEEEAVEPEVVVEAAALPPSPICRGCRRPARERPVERDRLCCFCLAAPPCGNERTNALNGRDMVCIRPLGHRPPCEEGHADGSLWYADTGLAAGGVIQGAEPVFTVIDETHVFTRTELAAHVEALRQAERDAHPVRWIIVPAEAEPVPDVASGYRACMERLAPPVDAVVEPDRPADADSTGPDGLKPRESASPPVPRWLRWLPGGRS